MKRVYMCLSAVVMVAAISVVPAHAQKERSADRTANTGGTRGQGSFLVTWVQTPATDPIEGILVADDGGLLTPVPLVLSRTATPRAERALASTRRNHCRRRRAPR